MSDASAAPVLSPLCPVHGAASSGTCSRCGNFTCAQCPVDAGLCEACQQRVGLQTPPFFAIGLGKLAFLYIASLGLFPLYWFYKQWQAQRERGSDVSPFWRAVFAGITSFSLFGRVQAELTSAELGLSVPGVFLGLAYLVASVTSQFFGGWGFLVGALRLPVLLIAQDQINALHAKVAPNANRNTRLTLWNLFALAPALVFFGLFIGFYVYFSRRVKL